MRKLVWLSAAAIIAATLFIPPVMADPDPATPFVNLPPTAKGQPGSWIVVIPTASNGGVSKWEASPGLSEVDLGALFGPELAAKARRRVFTADIHDELGVLNRALGFDVTPALPLTGPYAEKVALILASPRKEIFQRVIDDYFDLVTRHATWLAEEVVKNKPAAAAARRIRSAVEEDPARARQARRPGEVDRRVRTSMDLP